MRFILTAAAKDLKRRRADPVSLVIWIGIPIAIGGMLGLLFTGGGGGVPRARVLVADLDQSAASGLLVGVAGQGPLEELLAIEQVELEEGRARIDDGDGTALLVIPEGFQEALLAETPTRLRLVTNPAQQILPKILEQGLEVAIEAAFYLQRVFGDQLRAILQEGDLDNAALASLSVEIGGRFQQLAAALNPPLLQLELPAEVEEQPDFGFGKLFLPGILFMSILFIVQGMSADVWEEKEKGTLRRTLTAPQTVASFLGGKLAAGALLVACTTAVGLAVGLGFFGLDGSRAPAALVWCTFAGAALYSLFLLLQLLATTRRGANLLGTLVIFPLIMIGGSFFPFEAMPEWMQAVGRWTPNGLALVRLKDLLFGDPQPAAFLAAAAGIGAPAALAFLLSLRRMRGGFATS